MSALTTLALSLMVVPVRLIGRTQRQLDKAELRVLVQAWQLRQLLPKRSAVAAGQGA